LRQTSRAAARQPGGDRGGSDRSAAGGDADAVDAGFRDTTKAEPTKPGGEQEQLAELTRALSPEQMAEVLTEALTREDASA
jgi:hypothetical protein